MKRTYRLLLVGIALFFLQIGSAQSVFGKWKTIDDRNGQPKAIIKVYKEDNKMYGVVQKILEEGKENAKCEKCEGERKDKAIVGMKIIEDVEHEEDGVWKGKNLFDPEQAMTFRCRIWLNPENPNELKVRGYLAFIYRTQTWLRVLE